MMTRTQGSLWNVLKNLEFLKLWFGQIISNFGDRVAQIALFSTMVISLGKSGAEMATITFFMLLPSFLLGHIAGAAADRFSKKTIMVVSDIFRAILILTLGFLIFKGVTSAFVIYSVIFLIGVGDAFFYTAKVSVIPNLVRTEELQTANALTSTTGMIATLAGTYMAGMIIERFGLNFSYVVNGTTFCLSAVILVFLRFRSQIRTEKVEAVSLSKKFTEDFKTAWIYLKGHQRTWRLILLSIFLSFLSSFFYITLTTLAVDTFHLGTAGTTKLLTMLGCGMMLGAAVAILLNRRVKPIQLIIVPFCIIFAANITARIVNSYFLAWLWLLSVGASNSVLLITMDTLIQSITPERFRGKVFGLRSVLTTGAFLIALLSINGLLKITSPFVVLQIIAYSSLVLALLILFIEKPFGYLILRNMTRLAMKLLFSLEVEGAEHLRYQSKVILAGNHTGFLDGFVLMAAFNRRIRFLSAQKVIDWPMVGLLLKIMGSIPVVRGKGESALAEAVNTLLRGRVIGIFPEGKLTADGRMGHFHRGVSRLHQESGAPIIPFAIHGGFEAWGWNRSPKFRKIYIQFGQPITKSSKDEKALAEELRQRIEFMKESMERRERAKKNDVYEAGILSLMLLKSDIFGSRTALALKEENFWNELSYIEVSRRARDLSDYLIERGIKRGDRIAILCESRPEWGIAFFATVRAGAILVPLDTKLTQTEITSILSEAEPRILLTSSRFAQNALTIKTHLPSIEETILLEEKPEHNGLKSYSALKALNRHDGRDRTPDETALIIYTSGTTGNPKGVMTTFGNLIFQVRCFEEMMRLSARDMFLSILPLNHLLELTGGFLGVLHSGGRVCYSESLNPKEIVKIMQEKKVTYMITVPLFLKMLKNSIEKEIRKSGAQTQRLFNLTFKIARGLPSPVRKFLFSKIHAQFGGQLRGFISGGAPLEVEVGEFFERIGLPVYQGYGLTETSPVITVNTPQHNRLGSVGRPLPGAYVRIKMAENASEGEILTKGPHVMKGYYKKEALTDEVIDDLRWFHTGDLGKLDKDGFLYITGRIKNLIVLGGGKKVHPEEVEAALSQSPMIKEICVVGTCTKEGNKEGTEEVSAVIVPSEGLRKQHLEDMPSIERAIKSEISKLGQNIAQYKRPTKIVICLEDLPKTATRKIKRPLVKQWAEGQQTTPIMESEAGPVVTSSAQ
jgi:long-chain acyl-CoA synthetase